MDNNRQCVVCKGEIETVLRGFSACKDCKKMYIDKGNGDYGELVYKQDQEKHQSVFWINGQLSLVGPVVFACFTSLSNEQHYMAGPSMKDLKELTDGIDTTQEERATLTVIDEAEVSKLNLRFFNQAKKVVSEHRQTYYLGTH